MYYVNELETKKFFRIRLTLIEYHFTDPENAEERQKRKEIENALNNPNTNLQIWQNFAISEYGLINDDLRRKVWPLLVGIDPEMVEPAPTLDELKTHPEYNQVILDVNRSLKRFPPGIPYEQRIALQDQLTVLILRVIIKYPHLKYYQGYHDVAVTFLLVVGDEIAFHVMEILSTNHLVECMQETMEPTQKRLMSLYPLLRREKPALCDYLERLGKSLKKMFFRHPSDDLIQQINGRNTICIAVVSNMVRTQSQFISRSRTVVRLFPGITNFTTAVRYSCHCFVS